MSINTATGAITGTPTASATASPYSVTLSATNATGTGTATLTITIAPEITSALMANAAVGAAFNYQMTATNVPTSYSATGLPPGLSVNTSTGAITGTPTSAATASPYSVTLSASNAAGTGANKTLTITVAPVITSATTASGSGGSAFSYSITATNTTAGNGTISYGATGLPAGLSVNTSTGLISGTPTVNGTFPVTISATNTAGTGSATLTITLTATTPVITSATTASGSGGSPFSYQITASNVPTSYNATGLPSGLSVNTSTGLISGTPTVNGTFGATISATNASGTGSATLTITLTATTPVITSATTASGSGGSPFSYQITASNVPTSYNATGLPSGLSVNTSTGLISGTPTVNGTFPVTISATNAGGTGSATLTITLTATVPAITSATTANGTSGSAFSYQITATNVPTSYSASGLPAGLSVNTTTGLISGVPTTAAVGTNTVIVSATNAAGTGSQTDTFTITLGVPVINSATTATGSGGSAFSYQITATNNPASFNATGLPTGLTVNTTTGLISGTPTVNGTFSVTISATNATGTGSATLTITLSATMPAITSATMANGSSGSAFSYQITATNVPTSYNATGLPPGLSVNTSNGLISGTPTVNGAFSVTISATNAAGTGSQVLAISLTPTAQAAAMTVPLNTPTTLDLNNPFDSSVTGVGITIAPKHGTVTASGTKVTYTPIHNYFGMDTFSYVAYGSGGTSPPGVVTVKVADDATRPDPTKDANVIGLLSAQTETAQRFSNAQISNFQHRMESLHRSDNNGSGNPSGFGAVAVRTATEASTAVVADNKHLDGGSGTLPNNSSLLRVSAAPDASSKPDPDEGGRLKSVQFANNIVSLLTTQSLNLSSLADRGADSSTGVTGASNFWVEGIVNFGTRGATGGQNGLDFTTSGISIGVDRRYSDKLAMGVGFGFARDKTDIGTDGSYSRAHGSSVTVYGSYQPSGKTFVDGLIGYGLLNFETKRYVAPVNDFALGNRGGYQVFSSLAAGYEHRDERLLVSPYARLDYSADHLNQSTETGAGQNALTYFSQVTPSVQGALGMRAEAMHETSYGSATPRIRAEYRHDFQGERQVSIAYADLINGPRYASSTGAVLRNSFVLGIGDDFVTRDGLSIGIDYQLLHSFSSQDVSQSVALKVTKDLDRRGGLSDRLLGIQTDFGYTFDDNVTRAKEPADKLSDRAFSMNLSKVFIFPVTDNTRALLTGSLGGEKFDNYVGLSRVIGGAQGEFQYRSSSEFSAPIIAAFAKTFADQYQSALRDGYRYSAGASIRQPVTDRIRLFGALAHNGRHGRSAVFDTKDNSARLNLDYVATRSGTIYLGAEYRRGDIVSTGSPSLENIDTAKVFAQDDAFPGGQLFSYRFGGKTVLTTLGYNISFGSRDSLDFSWLRVKSTPDWRPSYATSPSSYVANRFSVVYLVTF